MKFVQTAALAACASVAIAGPVAKRQAINDGIILNFALTLEFLEAQFYKEALANYTDADFTAAGFPGVRDIITEVAADEQAHVDFLVGIISQ
jgi:rubrerythrin